MTRPLSLARPAGTRLNSDYAGCELDGSAAGERNATPLMLGYTYDGPDAVGCAACTERSRGGDRAKEPPDDQPMNVGGRISSAQRVW